jgi:hypothetical protein
MRAVVVFLLSVTYFVAGSILILLLFREAAATSVGTGGKLESTLFCEVCS